MCLRPTGNTLKEGKAHELEKLTMINVPKTSKTKPSSSLIFAVSLSRIALCLDGQSRFCNNTHHLMGKEATKRRHLRRIGYEVVQVGVRKRYEYDHKIPLTWQYNDV